MNSVLFFIGLCLIILGIEQVRLKKEEAGLNDRPPSCAASTPVTGG